MTRSKNTPATSRRRKKILKKAKGYHVSKHKLFKTAKEQIMRSLSYSYAHRKKRASFFRSKV
jgi:large subunit ribosomal protein L20